MRNIISAALIILIFTKADGQYYYSDITGTKQSNQLYKLMRSFQYKRVNATSYDQDGLSKDFLLEQVFSDDGRKITTHSASVGNMESYFTSYYQNNKVSKTVDSGNNAITTVLYEYDNSGKIISTTAASKDFDGTVTSKERHIWSYNDKGAPVKMLKIKNQSDTTLIAFTIDEAENVTEEKWIKNNKTIETYYYYYNPKKQLTDIVRFSRKAKAMLPDYIFEYDSRGHIAQMTQTQSGTANYLVWKYVYNENNLKEKEIVFNKQKEMLGRIEYKYQ